MRPEKMMFNDDHHLIVFMTYIMYNVKRWQKGVRQ